MPAARPARGAQGDVAVEGRGPSGRQRFLREAQAAAAIVHDHVVTIHQVGEAQRRAVSGHALARRRDPGGTAAQKVGLPISKVLRLGCEVALGLEAVHQRDLIHRDIKPANLWMEDLASRGRQPPVASEQGADAPRSPTRVKILDFGLARPMHEAVHLTRRDTRGHAGLHVARAGTRDARRCAVRSLQPRLRHVPHGDRRTAVSGRNSAAVLHSLATVHPTPPRQLNPDVPPAWKWSAAFARDPADRPLQPWKSPTGSTCGRVPPGVGRLSESASVQPTRRSA